ncbi:uncharacterized protein LOC106708316 isoform X1 [Papilio machaon]|uniref:uncharacterized protein LOC106708316 isoform X1 n=1 Tax=Papilio machaon TaxID=76193 RepID=UPI001E664348|nr:uncharacterized protein LOC106708316 isoform X1 [Papilio machaon]XP_045538505.1 uncharacterized protein LOC106708316 isoform X1 [Papilio machaon]
MSARSSLSSGSGRLPGATDIIDLDRYMRAAVRPGISPRHDRRERLVVDAGGFGRKAGRGPLASNASSSSATAGSNSDPPHMKRFSHDSGLSDGSNPQHRHRSHRRVSGDVTTHRCRESARGRGSASSLLAFRAACERALREQQEQIARVAQLCERLGERRNERRNERHSERRNERRTERVKCVRPKPERPKGDRSKPDRSKPERLKPERSKSERPKPKRPIPECSTTSIESSNISSSSRSSRERHKDKHRTDECKTYKIIMNKLDELSRLFAARRPMAPLTLSTKPMTLYRDGFSSGSVSVSDKIVATEPDLHTCITSRQLSPTVQILLTPRPTERKVDLQIQTKATGTTPIPSGEQVRQKDRMLRGERRREVRPCENRRLAVTRAHFLEIAPLQEKRPNVATERVVQRDLNSDCNTTRNQLTSFDLDDPLSFYAQAKRLQALYAEPRRARSEDRELRNERTYDMRGFSVGGRFAERLGKESLCARCRVYWRAFRDCFTTQLFCRPGRACAC